MRKIVHCFGTYDKTDGTCYGDVETGEESCALKDDCNPFTRYLRRTKKEAEEFFKYVSEDGTNYAVPIDGEEKFWRFVGNLPKATKPKKQKPKKRKTRSDKKDGRRKPPTKKNKIASRKALKKISIEKRQKLLGIFEEFQRVLIEKLDDGRTFTEPGKAIVPGHFYATNRMDSSRYISVFCRMLKGFDLPIVRLRIKTRELAFDVMLAESIKILKKRLPKTMIKKLQPMQEIDVAKLKTEIKSVKAEGLVLIAEIIARLVKDDIIELPSL